jgi:hypothetical protein
MAINQSSAQGALFELVARGVKDHYFVRDSKDSYFPYDGRYESSCHHLAERRTIVPLNQPKFGNTFEVEIDTFGDVMTECAFEIDLPTWLPSLPTRPDGELCNPERINGLYWITDTQGFSYGYVNYIGYYLFEKIQFYQDQFLIQEWSGEGLLSTIQVEGSWNQSFLSQTIGGLTSPTPRGIALRATPGHLRVKLPLPGIQTHGDSGFPILCAPHQTFRIKATLRNLEDLVVSDNPINKPAPWSVPQFNYTTDQGPITFSPLSKIQMGQPNILLSCIQHYVPPDTQAELRSSIIRIPFRKQFENIFTFGELDYKALDNGSVAAVTRRLDGRHPTEKIAFFFRNQNAIDRNRLDDYFNDRVIQLPSTEVYQTFYNRIKLVIAGKDREHLLEPFVWNQMNSFCKDERANGVNISEMKWSLGEKYGTVYPTDRQPEGTINFTTADRPTLYIELTNININPILLQRKSEMRVFTEGWAVYEFREGRGRLVFSN